MDPDRLLDLLLEAVMLKRVTRSGWAMRGVPHVESVAEHSFGVAFVALALADTLGRAARDAIGDGDTAGQFQAPLDLQQVLVMAVLHDLAEVRLMDLPATAMRLIPQEVKSQAEAAAMADLLASLPGAERLLAAWRAFEDRSSPEGRLVRDADKLEMMAQCLRYEEAGSRSLDEFWQTMDEAVWHYELARELYERLRARRER